MDQPDPEQDHHPPPVDCQAIAAAPLDPRQLERKPGPEQQRKQRVELPVDEQMMEPVLPCRTIRPG